MSQKSKILITGAAGRIGSFLTAHLSDQLADEYDLILADVREPEDSHGYPFKEADISDLVSMRALCQGIDTIIHLAADPNTRAPWESLLPRNVVGVYNVFQAAHEAGCRRVIFASSINAVSGYPREVQVHTDMPVRPPNLYGATKAWGEAVAYFYADQHNLSAICLRFAWVTDRNNREHIRPGFYPLNSILTYEDLTRLVAAAIETDTHFGIYHGVSNNRYKRLDIEDARREIGYAPQDDAFELAEEYASSQ